MPRPSDCGRRYGRRRTGYESSGTVRAAERLAGFFCGWREHRDGESRALGHAVDRQEMARVVVLVVVEEIIRQHVDLPGVAVRVMRPHLVLSGVAAGGVRLVEGREPGGFQALLGRFHMGRTRNLEAQVTEDADP